MYRFSILLFLSVVFSLAKAEEADTLLAAKPLKYDTNYIKSKRDWIHIKLVTVNNQTTIDLANSHRDYSLRYISNAPYRWGIGLDYEWIALEYTHTIPGLELNDKAQGSSETFTFRLGLSGRKFRANAYYRETKGFSHQNIEQLNPHWFETELLYPYSEDLRSQTLNLSLYYTFNHQRFSNTAAIRQIDRQIKSAGSSVLGMVANFEGIYSPTPIILQDSLLDKFLNIKRAEYFKIGLNGGYMYTFSFWKQFYLHAAIVPGLLYGYGDVILHNIDASNISHSLGASLYSRFTIGYNGKRFYGGIYAVGDFYANDILANQTALTTYTYLKFFVGYRFPLKKQKWMKRFYL